jgi:hypothetical protein
MNRVKEPASMPSMSARAGTTSTQVARIAEANLEQMKTQLNQWGAKLAALVDQVVAPGADARTSHHEAIDALRTKYEISRRKFEEFENAGGAQWPLFSSGIEVAWTDFENALDKLTNGLVHMNNVEGETHEDPPAP